MLTDPVDNDLLYNTVLPIPIPNVEYHQHAKRLYGDGRLEAGVRLLPFIIFMVLFSMLNGALMPKLGYITPWYSFGSALILIGTALMCRISHLAMTQSLILQTPLTQETRPPNYMATPS